MEYLLRIFAKKSALSPSNFLGELKKEEEQKQQQQLQCE
jgi:hypothetical protein